VKVDQEEATTFLKYILLFLSGWQARKKAIRRPIPSFPEKEGGGGKGEDRIGIEGWSLALTRMKGRESWYWHILEKKKNREKKTFMSIRPCFFVLTTSGGGEGRPVTLRALGEEASNIISSYETYVSERGEEKGSISFRQNKGKGKEKGA